MKNKIFSAIICMTMFVCSAGNYQVNAEPVTYFGHTETIFFDGCIFKVKDTSNVVTLNTLGVDNPKGYYTIFSIELTDEKEIGYDGRLHAYYNDEKFGGYARSDEVTGYYYTNALSYKEVSDILDVEETYRVFMITRNGFNENGFATELGGGYNKVFKSDEILENDANNDGKITAEDALKVLNAVVNKETFTIEEKIQLGISNSFNYVDSEEYQNLTSEKALEILRQVAES